MPGAGSHGSDWDLDQLADYAAGLLDDSGAAAMAAVLARDPAAAQVFAALPHADDLVRGELRALPAITMPPDIAARLDAALTAEAAAAPPVSELPARDEPVTVAAPSAETVTARALRATSAGGDSSGSETSPDNVVPLRRRRWTSGAAAVAAGVAVLAAGAVGVSQLGGAQPASDSRESATAGAAQRDARVQSGTPLSGGAMQDREERAATVVASGTDYRKASLAQQISRRVTADSTKAYAAPPAAALQRFGAAALRNCLQMLGISGDAPGLSVDLAKYEGDPAVVVTVLAGDTYQVTVAGPDCGESGADVTLRTTVPTT
jgi:negative regulator of sigma E activity